MISYEMIQRREKRARVAGSLGFLWASILLLGFFFGMFDRIEDVFLDYSQKKELTNIEKDNDLALISIEKTTKDHPWPWSLFDYTILLQGLMDSYPESIVFDVLFHAKEPFAVDYEQSFISYIDRFPKIAFASLVMSYEDDLFISLNGIEVIRRGEIKTLPVFHSLLWPLEKYTQERLVGVRNLFHPVSNETFRYVPLLLRYEEHLLPSLILQAAILRLNASPEKTRVTVGQSVEIRNAQGKVLREIPIDQEGRMRLRFHPNELRPLKISYDEFIIAADQRRRGIKSNPDTSILRKRQVWISCTDRTVRDFFRTTVGSLPPAFLNMQGVRNILRGDFVHPLNPIFVMFLFLICGVFLSRSFVFWGIVPAVLMLLTLAWINFDIPAPLLQLFDIHFPQFTFFLLLIGIFPMGLSSLLWQMKTDSIPQILLEV